MFFMDNPKGATKQGLPHPETTTEIEILLTYSDET